MRTSRTKESRAADLASRLWFESADIWPNPRPKSLCVDVLEAMPEADREQLLQARPLVLYVPPDQAIARPVDAAEDLQWLVIVRPELPVSDAVARAMIAHEFAHVVLGHRGRMDLFEHHRREAAANALAIAWGFAEGIAILTGEPETGGERR